MPIEDIRPIKNTLRQKYKEIRLAMSAEEKTEKDASILRRVLSLWQYKCCSYLLVYVSTAIEVDTRRLIERALKDGKKVAVPRCVPGTREMEF